MNLEYNIAKMEEQVTKLKSEIASMKKQLEQQNKLELKGGSGYWLQTSGTPIRSSYSTSRYVERGAFRHKKELAEIADKNMVTRNRLEAYAMQLEPEWRDSGQVSYVIYKVNGVYETSNEVARVLGGVYMSKETAEILCSALNRGEMEL